MDIIINETTLISDNIVWDNINNYINTNVSIIYIGSNATLNDKLLSLHKNREFDKLIIISKSDISDRYLDYLLIPLLIITFCNMLKKIV